jgi:hypothetical protein
MKVKMKTQVQSTQEIPQRQDQTLFAWLMRYATKVY